MEKHASVLKSKARYISPFDCTDPVNAIKVTGAINNQDGAMGGSFVITHVNGAELAAPQVNLIIHFI